MGKVTTEAIVLRRTPFGETSQVAEFLTQREGRLSLMLKGVHRPRAAKGGGVDLLDECVVTYVSRRRSRSLPMVSERRGVRHHAAMRRRDDLMLAGQYLVELLQGLLPEGQPVPGVFRLGRAYLAALDASPAPSALPAVVFAMEGGMLRMAGFEPVLDRCVGCDRRPTGFRTLRCDPARGGVVCAQCRTGDEDAFDLSSAAAETIVRLTATDPREACGTELAEAVVRDARRFFDRVFVHVLERRPRCLLLPVEEAAAAGGRVGR